MEHIRRSNWILAQVFWITEFNIVINEIKRKENPTKHLFLIIVVVAIFWI